MLSLRIGDTTLWCYAVNYSRYMATVLLTGATGVLGQQLQPRLLSAGNEVRAASRSPPSNSEVSWVAVDLTTGHGIQEAVACADIVVHAASDARGDSKAVDVHGTERLLSAVADAAVRNFVYISIVGVDEIPYTYYEHKHKAEQAIAESAVPSTIIRSTQFYPFVAYLLNLVSRLPIWPLPTEFKLQPIDVGEAADEIVEYATVDASGRVPDIGGPNVHSVRTLAEAYREHRGLHRPIIRLPIPGRVASSFRAGKATCPTRTRGTITWEAWLASQAGVPGRGAY